jgi:serine/threonine protein kinase
MPFLKGRPLDQVMRMKPIPWQQALDIGLAAGEALNAIHSQGAAHRGFKPANVWLTEDGSIVLSDCCIGRFTEIAGLDANSRWGPRVDFADTIIPMGALAYMSPEQIRGEEIDYRTDIFSFGAVLYEMLGGRHPFEARNSLSRMSAILEADPPPLANKLVQVSPELDFILRKALAKDPDARYRSMKDLLADLAMIRANTAKWPVAPGISMNDIPLLRSARKLALVSFALLMAALFLYLLLQE